MPTKTFQLRFATWLKLGQLLGFALMAIGVGVFVLNDKQGFTWWMIGGMLVYAGCRLAAWLHEK